VEDILREPVELVDDDLDEVAGGAAGAAATSLGNFAAATASSFPGFANNFSGGQFTVFNAAAATAF
jgi:hypothetical protein